MRLAEAGDGHSLDPTHWETMPQPPQHIPPSSTLSMDLPFSLRELEHALGSMHPRKAPGDDGVTTALMQAIAHDPKDHGTGDVNLDRPGALALLRVANTIFSSAVIPKVWRCATIISIPKKGDATLASNLRGISLINVGLKILCKMVQARLSSLLESNNVLVPEQGGFRTREESTAQASLFLENAWQRPEINELNFSKLPKIKNCATADFAIGLSVLHSLHCLSPDLYISMPPKAKEQLFIAKHQQQFGLVIKARDAATATVTSVACRFCITFGKEEEVGRKRKATSNVKYFESFRTDNYLSHLQGQHSLNERPLQFLINKDIVDIIIGDLLFYPDDVEGISHTRALTLFKLAVDEEDNRDPEQRPVDNYMVTVKMTQRFNLCVRYIACGATFRMASRLMQATVEESRLAYLRGCSDTIASDYARIVCAASLQKISEALEAVWAFSIALDCSTHQSTSYLDVRCRFCLNEIIYNFHLMAIPLFESHTGENMFATLVKFMNALIPSWRNRLVGVSTDGDRSMTGRIRGLSTRIESEASPGIIQIWCGLHQMDLVMQRVFESALNEGYLTVLTTLIGYLRRQQNLIADMRVTCPKVATTRWLSMGTVAKWLTSNRVRIQRYLQDKNASCAPSPVWWTFLFAIQAIAEEASVVFISLQGLSTFVSQQRARLVGLVETYCQMSGMVGPLETSQLEMIDSSTTARCRQFALSYENARSCLDGLGVWVLETLDTLSQDDVSMLVTAIAQMLCQLAQGLHAVVAERDCVNDVGEEFPPVLPHQLARVDVRRFSSTLNAHKTRIQAKFDDQQIDELNQQFVMFLRAYREERAFKDAIDQCDNFKTDFKEAWSLTNGRFPMLSLFCGGLASAFPNTSTVESDFSLLGYEKDDTRKCLTDFSLDGIFHCKQWMDVRNLALPQ
ncbi:hypothetical protein BASA60_007513 [Batrachochytrium salamandrivorans]|nr:hypothetical protein BASA60_007513 [Batrachochytrium salamandrivorans]